MLVINPEDVEVVRPVVEMDYEGHTLKFVFRPLNKLDAFDFMSAGDDVKQSIAAVLERLERVEGITFEDGSSPTPEQVINLRRLNVIELVRGYTEQYTKIVHAQGENGEGKSNALN